jgi:hypothetical protein
MYDDFGGVITDIQNAVVVKNNSGEKLAELKSEYGNNSELSELLNTFEEKYISELE